MGIVVEEHDLLVCPRCLAVFRTGFRACPRDGETLTATRTDPLIGTTVAERYQIEGLIGEGGIGRVYKARHARMSRRYAVKIPCGEVAYDPKVRARFANEAEAASRLSHPNVVGVVDFGETETGLLYMAMDYADGKSLAALIAETGPLDRNWVIRFTREIAEGLAHAHDRGLIHRDLKPDNIIIERDGDRPRIVDFGLAIFREQEGGRMTSQGTVLGTPHYMAPEQATGQEIDQRTDLFALGLCMYEMIAGVLPFDGTPVQVARRNLSSPVPLISERVPGLDVDPGLEALCHHLLAKRTEERPASANAVIEMLSRLERGDSNTWQMEQLQVPAGPAADAPAAPAAPAAIPRTTGDMHALVAAGRRRRLALELAALVVLVGGGVLIWRVVRQPSSVGALPPAPDAMAVVVAPVDAPPAAPEVIDAAAMVSVAPADAAPPGKPDARTTIAVRPRPDARVAAARPDARQVAAAPADARPPAAPDAAPPVVAEKTVKQIYARVGEAIERLRVAKGDAAASAYKQRWFDLPYVDALGNPALRPELISKLQRLEKEVIGATN